MILLQISKFDFVSNISKFRFWNSQSKQRIHTNFLKNPNSKRKQAYSNKSLEDKSSYGCTANFEKSLLGGWAGLDWAASRVKTKNKNKRVYHHWREKEPLHFSRRFFLLGGQYIYFFELRWAIFKNKNKSSNTIIQRTCDGMEPWNSSK